MRIRYEINQLEKEESWRMFRIMGEFVEGFDTLSQITPAVTVFGSAQARPGDFAYDMAEAIGREIARTGFTLVTGGGPGVMEAVCKGAFQAGGTTVGLTSNFPGATGDPVYDPLASLPLVLRAEGHVGEVRHRLRLAAGRIRDPG
jgi:hypothetical protein